jgi:hypothetical protein
LVLRIHSVQISRIPAIQEKLQRLQAGRLRCQGE